MIETWDNPYRGGMYLRRELMPRLDNGPLHQARMSLALARKIVELSWRQGWLHNDAVVVSPMMGEGSELLMAGLTGMVYPLFGPAPLRLYGIEVSNEYAVRAKRYFAMHGLDVQISVQDARAAWPIAWPRFDLALFSPTYEGALSKWCEGPHVDAIRYGNDKTRPNPRPKLGGACGYAMADGQIGALRGAAWREAMRSIYRRCAENAQQTARMILVTKNRRDKNEFIDVTGMSIKDATMAGWTQIAHVKAFGAAQSIWAKYNNNHYTKKGRSDLVIKHEDITVFQLTS